MDNSNSHSQTWQDMIRELEEQALRAFLRKNRRAELAIIRRFHCEFAA